MAFLFDYKMDFARKLLDSGSYNVNEVGLQDRIQHRSHFGCLQRNLLQRQKILNVHKSEYVIRHRFYIKQ
jgi:hypothetical protein